MAFNLLPLFELLRNNAQAQFKYAFFLRKKRIASPEDLPSLKQDAEALQAANLNFNDKLTQFLVNVNEEMGETPTEEEMPEEPGMEEGEEGPEKGEGEEGSEMLPDLGEEGAPEKKVKFNMDDLDLPKAASTRVIRANLKRRIRIAMTNLQPSKAWKVNKQAADIILELDKQKQFDVRINKSGSEFLVMRRK